MDCVPVLTGLKEIVVTVAAATGAIVAYLGLSRWRAELQGRSNHEAAHDLLEKLFRVRSSIHTVRNNIISAFEVSDVLEISERERITEVFRKRWVRLDSALIELDSARFKAQAMWGKEFEKCLEPVYALTDELNYSINEYLGYLSDDPKEKTSREQREASLELRRIVFHVPILDKKNDSYADRLYRAIQGIEDEVRDRLLN